MSNTTQTPLTDWFADHEDTLGKIMPVTFMLGHQKAREQDVLIRELREDVAEEKLHHQTTLEATSYTIARLEATIRELTAALDAMCDAFDENDGRIPSDGRGPTSIDEQNAINRTAIKQARAALAKAQEKVTQ